MFDLIARLHDIAEKLEEVHDRSDLSDRLDVIASKIVESYTFRIHRPRKGRGTVRTKRRMYYKTHRQRSRTRMRIYRRLHRTQLHRRRRLRHYHRFG